MAIDLLLQIGVVTGYRKAAYRLHAPGDIRQDILAETV